jgi:hypothetical protein
MTPTLKEELSKEKGCDVEVVMCDGLSTYVNDGESFSTPHGSLWIIENVETKKFHVSDFGDDCAHVFPLVYFKNFGGMTLGQYNRHKIETDIPEQHLRDLIKPGYYPESFWNFGERNFDTIQKLRNSVTLDSRLHFRGTVYPGLRDTVEVLTNKYSPQVYIGAGRLDFTKYLAEVASFKMTLSMGMSTYNSDLCFRDIEMFGLGIPVIRPRLYVELADPLIPDVHYISCDVELDPYTLWTDNPKSAADVIYKKYNSVVSDNKFINYVSANAKEWYTRNIANANPAKNLSKWVTI